MGILNSWLKVVFYSIKQAFIKYKYIAWMWLLSSTLHNTKLALLLTSYKMFLNAALFLLLQQED